MILEIINKANEYAEEYKFCAKIRSSDFKSVLLQKDMPLNKWINLVDTVGMDIDDVLMAIDEKVSAICNIAGLDEKFSPEFKDIFKNQIICLVNSSIQITSDNCYMMLIQPILDRCEMNQNIVHDLKNLLCELDPKYFRDVITHPKIIVANISVQDIGGMDDIVAQLPEVIAACKRRVSESSQEFRTLDVKKMLSPQDEARLREIDITLRTYQKVLAKTNDMKRKLEHVEDEDDIDQYDSIVAQRPHYVDDGASAEAAVYVGACHSLFGE